LKYYIFFLFCFPSFVFCQDTLSLEQSIQLAIENNFNIKIVSNDLNKAKKQHHIGNAGMLPSISSSATFFDLGTGRVEQNSVGQTDVIKPAKTRSFNYSVNASQTLFDGLAMFKAYDRLGELVDFQSLKKREEVENVVTQVISLYYNVLVQDNLVKTTLEAVSLSAQRLELASKRLETGAGLRLDVLNAKVDLASDSSALLESQRAMNESKLFLNYLLGLPKGQTEKEFMDSVILNPYILNELTEKEISSNVLIKQSLKNEKVTELDYQLFQAAKLPEIYLSGRFSHSNSQRDFGFASKTVSDLFSLDLTASYTLFQGFQRNIQIQTAKIDYLNQQLQTQELELRIGKDFKTSKQNLKTRLSQYELERNNLGVFQENYERSKKSYEYGKITTTQLREAQLNLIQAKRRLFEAKINAKLEEVELLRLSGMLLSDEQ